MSINASNYVVTTASPSVPRISVNVQTVTSDAVDSAVSVYLDAATVYASSFVDAVANRDYATDRLKKDLAAGVEYLTDGGINLETNQIALHVKVDDLYAHATATASLNSVTTVSTIEANFNSLCDTYYMENDSCVLEQAASCYAAPEPYDTRAFVIDADITSHVASDSVFILDNPNATGSKCTYTNYSGSTAQYSLAYDTAYPVDSSTVVSAWVIKEPVESGAVIAYSIDTDLAAGMTWVTVE